MLKPHLLLDAIKSQFNLRNDRALCIELGIAPPQVSKIRNGNLPVTDAMILRIHERMGIPVADIRHMVSESV